MPGGGYRVIPYTGPSPAFVAVVDVTLKRGRNFMDVESVRFDVVEGKIPTEVGEILDWVPRRSAEHAAEIQTQLDAYRRSVEPAVSGVRRFLGNLF
jgi:hypothetical protein